jgi:uncharacterized protein (TIGR03435 family)
MLQNLLVERFQIKFHYVTKEEPGFALVVAKNGPKMNTSTSEEEKLTFFGPNGEELSKPMGKAIRVNARWSLLATSVRVSIRRASLASTISACHGTRRTAPASPRPYGTNWDCS